MPGSHLRQLFGDHVPPEKEEVESASLDELCSLCSAIDLDNLWRNDVIRICSPAEDSTCAFSRFAASIVRTWQSFQPLSTKYAHTRAIASQRWVADRNPCLLRVEIVDYLIGIYAVEELGLELLPDWTGPDGPEIFNDAWKERFGSIIREGDLKSPSIFLGRRVPRKVPFDLIKGWIQHYNEAHRGRGNCHAIDPRMKFQLSKVIDCEKREIIDMPPNSTP